MKTIVIIIAALAPWGWAVFNSQIHGGVMFLQLVASMLLLNLGQQGTRSEAPSDHFSQDAVYYRLYAEEANDTELAQVINKPSEFFPEIMAGRMKPTEPELVELIPLLRDALTRYPDKISSLQIAERMSSICSNFARTSGKDWARTECLWAAARGIAFCENIQDKHGKMESLQSMQSDLVWKSIVNGGVVPRDIYANCRSFLMASTNDRELSIKVRVQDLVRLASFCIAENNLAEAEQHLGNAESLNGGEQSKMEIASVGARVLALKGIHRTENKYLAVLSKKMSPEQVELVLTAPMPQVRFTGQADSQPVRNN